MNSAPAPDRPDAPESPVDSAMPLLDRLSGFTSLGMTHAPGRLHLLTRLSAGLCVAAVIGLVLLPWRQFVSGSGRVIAFNPLERSLTVESPLPGKVQRAFVVEGQEVKEGEALFEIVDNDPNLLSNLLQQRDAAQARRDAARTRVESLGLQIGEQERALPLAIEAAKTRLSAARYAADTARLQFDRVKALHEDPRGLVSRRDFELATLERDRTEAELVRAQAELERTPVDLRGSIQGITAQRDSARAELASAEQALTGLEIQINQTRMQKVTAPRDGIVFRLQATEGTFLRAGSPLCTIIARTDRPMVEVWLQGLDMPLVLARQTGPGGEVLREGSPVRLQFEGWPALQLIGWPSLARGTFGGEVVLVDPTDNGKGKFRILVAEKPDLVEGKDGQKRPVPWPDNRWLRQGVRANGWVLLQRVPLWYEVWRQLNGFPPVLSEELLEPKK
jgi:adhesin transport system membrane fusion protein